MTCAASAGSVSTTLVISSMVTSGSERSRMILRTLSDSGGSSMVASSRCWMRRAVKACTARVMASPSSPPRSGVMAPKGSPKRPALAFLSRGLKSCWAISSHRPGSPVLISSEGCCSKCSSYRQGELTSAGKPGSWLRPCLSSKTCRRSGATAVMRRPVKSARRFRSSK